LKGTQRGIALAVLTAGLLGRPALGQSVTGGAVDCTDGRADRYPCEKVDLESYLAIEDLGGQGGVQANDIWGWTDPQTGAEYALVGLTDAVAFVDVSTPTEPVYLGELPTHTEASSWRDVKVYDGHAYVVSEARDHGLQVMDLAQLRSVSDPPVVFTETAHYDRFDTAHNIAINPETGSAYVVGVTGDQNVPSAANCGAGLHIIDLTTPTQPRFAGCHTDRDTGGQIAPGYTHDAQCVVYEGPDVDYQGREVCFSANESQVNIADVEDKANPETITNVTYPRYGYVHQAWLTENQRYLLVDDETDERNGLVRKTRTLVFDVSNLDNPELVKSYAGKTSSSDHNQYVVGNYSYQANYQSGLRILDVSDPENPVEAAFFDTYPAANRAGFQGAWSVYPFFESGVVIVSSISEGLFVLDPSLSPLLSFEAEAQQDAAALRWSVSAAARTERVDVEHRPPGAQRWATDQRLDGRSGEGTQAYEYRASDLVPGTHRFRVRHVGVEGRETVSTPVRVRIRPETAVLLTGLPNPVRGSERFTLIPRASQPIRVHLFDTLGRRVARIYEGTVQAGASQSLALPASSLASGLYILRIQGRTFQETRKVMIRR
jgi:choice-of-anchor B domain-containing protein